MSRDGLSGPDDCNCLAARQAARHITQFYDQLLAPSGLRTTQFSILAKLRQLGPMTINVLAADMVMDRTTLGRNILPLQRDGLIVVERGSRDRRSKTLQLTDSGVARFQAASKRWVHAQRHFEAAFGAKRTKDLRALLHTVAATDLTTAVDINESSGSGLREIPLDLRLANARRCGTPRLLNDTSKPHSASKNEGPSPQQEDHEAERGNTATEGTRCAEMAAPDRQILLTNPDARSMATSGRDNNIWDEPMEWLQYRFITKWGRLFGYGRIWARDPAAPKTANGHRRAGDKRPVA